MERIRDCKEKLTQRIQSFFFFSFLSFDLNYLEALNLWVYQAFKNTIKR